MSKVVHNQESHVFRVMYSLEVSKNARYRAKNIATQVLLALIVFDEALKRLGPYMAWDLTDPQDNGCRIAGRSVQAWQTIRSGRRS